jgi:hypothetical protein
VVVVTSAPPPRPGLVDSTTELPAWSNESDIVDSRGIPLNVVEV